MENNEITTTGSASLYSTELEQSVIGALLIDKYAIDVVYSDLKPDTFYKSWHIEIYRAIAYLYEVSDDIDMETVIQRLRDTKKIDLVGGARYISSLTDRVMSSTNIETHVRKLKELSMKRDLMKTAREILSRLSDSSEDVFDLLDDLNGRLSEIEEGSNSSVNNNMLHYAKKAMTSLRDKSEISVLKTGIESFDKAIGGGFLTDGSFNVFSAPPSMGKTAFAIYLARCLAMQGHNIGVISMEMSSILLTTRHIVTEFYYHGLHKEYGSPTFEKFATKTMSDTEEEGLNLMMAESSYLADIEISEGHFNLNEVIAKMRYLKRTKNVKAIVIDYIQLIELTTNKTKADELHIICRKLIKEAKRLKVALIVLAQMNREAFKRGDKKPILSDLGEGSALEKSADTVTFLHRPEYYGETHLENGESTEGMLMLIVAKARYRDKNDREHLLCLHPEHKTIHKWEDRDAVLGGSRTAYVPNNKPKELVECPI